jgi:hypothetical protein
MPKQLSPCNFGEHVSKTPTRKKQKNTQPQTQTNEQIQTLATHLLFLGCQLHRRSSQADFTGRLQRGSKLARVCGALDRHGAYLLVSHVGVVLQHLVLPKQSESARLTRLAWPQNTTHTSFFVPAKQTTVASSSFSCVLPLPCTPWVRQSHSVRTHRERKGGRTKKLRGEKRGETESRERKEKYLHRQRLARRDRGAARTARGDRSAPKTGNDLGLRIWVHI